MTSIEDLEHVRTFFSFSSRRSACFHSDSLAVGASPLGIDDLIRITVGSLPIVSSEDEAMRERTDASRSVLLEALERGDPVYGVTIGFGSNCGTRITPDPSLVLESGRLPYHGCGVGAPLPEDCVRGGMLCRIMCLSPRLSGVTRLFLQQLVAFVSHGITPVVPCQGSVGASGDLTQCLT